LPVVSLYREALGRKGTLFIFPAACEK
jgi:hypothetical protein